MNPVPRGNKRFLALCVVTVLVAALAFGATGCGETVIDTTKAEDTIQADVERSRSEKVESVECPQPEVDPGTTFDCTVNYPGGKQATITLKIRNENADLSTVGFEIND